MVIFHSYVSLPEGMGFEPHHKPMTLTGMQHSARLSFKEDVELLRVVATAAQRRVVNDWVPSGNLTSLWKITIYSDFSLEKW